MTNTQSQENTRWSSLELVFSIILTLLALAIAIIGFIYQKLLARDQRIREEVKLELKSEYDKLPVEKEKVELKIKAKKEKAKLKIKLGYDKLHAEQEEFEKVISELKGEMAHLKKENKQLSDMNEHIAQVQSKGLEPIVSSVAAQALGPIVSELRGVMSELRGVITVVVKSQEALAVNSQKTLVDITKSNNQTISTLVADGYKAFSDVAESNKKLSTAITSNKEEVLKELHKAKPLNNNYYIDSSNNSYSRTYNSIFCDAPPSLKQLLDNNINIVPLEEDTLRRNSINLLTDGSENNSHHNKATKTYSTSTFPGKKSDSSSLFTSHRFVHGQNPPTNNNNNQSHSQFRFRSGSDSD